LVFDPGLFADAFLSWKPAAKLTESTKDVISQVCMSDAGLVCFSLVTLDVAWATALAGEIKRSRPDLPIAVGGSHATVMPMALMEIPAIDYVVSGDGERTLPELVETIDRGQKPSPSPGLYYRDNGRVVGAPPEISAFDLDSLPYADRELFRSSFPGLAGIHMITSRHCPNHCAYCHNNVLRSVYGKHPPVRRYSPGRVVEEIAEAKEHTSLPSVRFFDELFSADEGWLSDFVRPYSEKVAWPFHCAVSPGTTTSETVRLLSQAGCYEVQMGVQTIRDDIKKDLLQRPETLDQICKALKLFRDRGIRVNVDLILGLPGVTENDMVETARFFANNKPTKVSVYWLQPIPGTDLTDYLHKIGWLTDQQKKGVEHGKDASGYFTGGIIYSRRKSLLPFEWLIATTVHRSPQAMEKAIRRGWFRRIPSWLSPQFLWFLVSLKVKHHADTMAIRMRNRYLTFLWREIRGLRFLRRRN